MERYALSVNKVSSYKARKKALRKFRGTLEEHYGWLRDYILELKMMDPKGTFELRVDRDNQNNEPLFKWIYIGFNNLRKGFTESCRSIISVNGAFLKTLTDGALLIVIGRYGNNQMFPITLAVL